MQRKSHQNKKYSTLLHLNRSSYYKWKERVPSVSQMTNEQLIVWIKDLYEEQDAITDAIEKMRQNDGDTAKKMLIRAQQETEEIYISAEERNP